MRSLPTAALVVVLASLSIPAEAQDASPPGRRAARREAETKASEDAVQRNAALAKGVELLLSMQEGDGADGKAEWPYEGVYRVRGSIPVGYRVGGTSICAMALLEAPGYDTDEPRREAVRRAAAFVCRAADDPLMSATDYDGGYDVRCWGYCYALQFLLDLRTAKAVPEGMSEEVDRRVRQYIGALQQVEIPQVGGWNYARPPGRESPAPASPFVTAPCLRALFEAKAQGFDVDAAAVQRGLDALERCRTASGAFAYAARGNASRSTDGTPGAIGRMVAAEVTLALAGRSDIPRIRGALDAFLAHWDQLEKRRQQPGTHVGPFAVAPYYFFYAHLYAAEAIEQLPAHERPYYRDRLAALLFKVREANGSWNDRVFPRSANFGTATALLALSAPNRRPPAGWPHAQE